MNEIEKLLAEEKRRLDKLEAPPELEERLRLALENTVEIKKPIKRKRALWASLAIAAMLMLMVGLNYQAFAYYGKRVFGFDEIMTETLKALNEKGMGQTVNKAYTLAEGVELTIDAIMTDQNRMLIFYTMTDPNGNLYDTYSDLFQPQSITGFLTKNISESGTGIFNEERTEFRGQMEFDPPNPFAKKLTLHYWQTTSSGKLIEKELSFPYDPSKALETQMKLSLNKSVKVDKGTIKFKSLTATPTMTVIKGKHNVDNFDRIQLGFDGIELIANGKVLQTLGSGASSSMTGGYDFELRFDALPSQIDTLTLHVKEYVGYKSLDKAIDLQEADAKNPVKLGSGTLWIEQVKTKEELVEITIVTDNDLLLDEVAVESDKGRTPLKTTIDQTEIKKEKGFYKKRTLVFPTNMKPTHLFIGGIHYMKKYDQSIEIPVK